MSNSTIGTSRCNPQDRLCIIQVYQVELIVIPVLLLVGFFCTLISIGYLRLCHNSQRQHYSKKRQHLQGIDAPPELNALDHEVVPMTAQSQNHKTNREPSGRQLSIKRQHCSFEHITPLCQSFTGKSGSTVTLYQATLDQKPVVLRVLNESADSRERQIFLGFAHFLSDLGPHPCLPMLLEVMREKDPLIIILEGLENRDLLGFLWRCRKRPKHCSSMTMPVCTKPLSFMKTLCVLVEVEELGCPDSDSTAPNTFGIDCTGQAAQCALTERTLFSMARQIASALEHLHSKNCVHGNISARSVLVGGDLSVKLWGLGPAFRRSISGEAKEIEMRKWQAPEVLSHRPISQSSDIWSFGILLYEMITLGEPPFPNVMASELLQYLQRGKSVKRPRNCSNSLYSIIKVCCQWKPQDRVSLKEVIAMLRLAERRASDTVTIQAQEPLNIAKYIEEAGYGETSNFAHVC